MKDYDAAVIDESTRDRFDPKPEVLGYKEVEPHILEPMVTEGFELYYMHDDTDENGTPLMVLGFRRVS